MVRNRSHEFSWRSGNRSGQAGGYLLLFVAALFVGLWLFTRLGPDREPVIPDDHPHLAGGNGGVVVPLAGGAYHLELLVESGGTLRVFILGRDETEMLDVPNQEVIAYINSGDLEVIPVTLQPDPLPLDPPGRTTQLVGELPESLRGTPLRLTIAGLNVAGQRYRIGAVWEPMMHDVAMPAKVTDEEERQLYLEPGGLYTEADIEANGGLTASQKFAGFRAEHDFSPQPGDAVCPVTRTKANPECSWIIGGQRYDFCCPPCIDEFLRLAKEQPEQVLPPDSYVK